MNLLPCLEGGAARVAVIGLVLLLIKIVQQFKQHKTALRCSGYEKGPRHRSDKSVRFCSQPDQVMQFSPGTCSCVEFWRCGSRHYRKIWDHSVFRASQKLRSAPSKRTICDSPRKQADRAIWQRRIENCFQQLAASLTASLQ